MIEFQRNTLEKKSEDQLRDILDTDFGFSLGAEKKSKPDMINIIIELQAARSEKNLNKFQFFAHLEQYLPLTEQMITDAFYNSSTAFREKYLKEKDISEEKKKDIFYEVRDIAISNRLSVLRPGSQKSVEKPVEKVVEKKLLETTNSSSSTTSKEIVPEKKEDLIQPAKESIQEDVDPSQLTKKGDKVDYVIDLLIKEGKDLSTEIKAKQVMDKFTQVFDDSVSDGYAYDKIVARKKSLGK